MIRKLKLIYTNFKINYLRHHFNFKNWRWQRYINVPLFEIHSNVEIPISEIRQRRFLINDPLPVLPLGSIYDVNDSGTEIASRQSNSQLIDVNSVIPYPPPVVRDLRYNLLSNEQIIKNGNSTTKFEFIMGVDGLEPPTNGL